MNRTEMIAMLERAAAHCAREDWKAALTEINGAPSNEGEADDKVTAVRIESFKAGGTAPSAAIDCIDDLRCALRAKLSEEFPDSRSTGSPILWVNTALQNLTAKSGWPKVFSDADISALVKAANLPLRCQLDDWGRTLSVRLLEIVSEFLYTHLGQQDPSPSAVEKRLRRIKKIAGNLLAVMPKRSGRDHVELDHVEFEVEYRLSAIAAVRDSKPDVENPVPGDVRLRAAVSAVADLAAWCEIAARREGVEIGKAPGNRGDIATQRLHRNLAGVWSDFWRRTPGASRSDFPGKVGGPYIRFVQAFLSMLREKLSDMDMALDPELRAALAVTPNAIRERLRKLKIGKFRDVVKSKRKEI